MDIDEITAVIIDAALELHRAVGPGLMEKFYVVVLADELRARGLKVEQEVSLRFLRVGLLINFGEATLKSGLRRVVNHYVSPSASPRLRVIQASQTSKQAQ